jgi:hypothetical protein
MPAYVAVYTMVNVTMILWIRYSYNHFINTESNNDNNRQMAIIRYRSELRMMAITLLMVGIWTSSVINFSFALLVAAIVTPAILLLAHRKVNSEPYTMKGFRLVQFIVLLLISPPGLLFVGELFDILSVPASILAHLANDYTRAGIMVYPFFCFCYHPAISALILSL